MRNYLLQTFFSIFFQCVLFICAKYYHFLIKLLNDGVQGAEGTQHKKQQKLCQKRSIIDEAQESTNYIMEEEIHAPCGSESVNVTLYQM